MGIRSMFLFFTERPVASCMVGFLMGVAIHSVFPLSWIPPIVWWSIGAVLLIIGLTSLFERRIGIFVLMSFVCVFGLWRFDAAIPLTPSTLDERNYTGIIKDVQEGMYGMQAKVALENGVIAQINLKNPVEFGATIGFSCGLRTTSPKADEPYRQFASNFHRYQARCTPKGLTVLASPAWWDVRQTFADVRAWTNRRIESSMPKDEGALIAGMLYGERGMCQKSNDLFRRAGLTHLIAVSGSNITIVASIVFAILLGCGLRRKQAFWGTVSLLASYVMFTGFSASVARAAVMGGLVLLARHWGRRPQTWHVLLVSATVLCLIDPWMLAYDAGFALSFLATMGLMMWSPSFTNQFKMLPEKIGVREAAATTAAATLMTVPYLAFAFERVSLAGLFTNIVAVPLVPWAMLFGALAAAWGDLPGYTLVSLPATGIAQLIFFVARLADMFPFLNVPMQSMDLTLLVGTYVLLIVIWFLLRGKNGLSTAK